MTLGRRNRFGLSREIPEAVKRIVRKRDGFGCVVCGLALYQYEHVLPVFADAAEHNPDGITLLCGTHHDSVTRGRLSKEAIRRHMSEPRTWRLGFAYDSFDIGVAEPTIHVGTTKASGVHRILRLMNQDVISVDPPEEPGSPYRLSARLENEDGAPILLIMDNEWRGSTANWDIRVVGRRLTITNSQQSTVLRIDTRPPDHLHLVQLDAWVAGVRIRLTKTGVLRLSARGGHEVSLTASGQNLESLFDMGPGGGFALGRVAPGTTGSIAIDHFEYRTGDWSNEGT